MVDMLHRADVGYVVFLGPLKYSRVYRAFIFNRSKLASLPGEHYEDKSYNEMQMQMMIKMKTRLPSSHRCSHVGYKRGHDLFLNFGILHHNQPAPQLAQ